MMASGSETRPSGAVPAPPTPDEEARLAELEGLDILDTAPEAAWDRVVKIASLICKTPISLVSLIDEDRQWFKARVGLDADQTPRDFAFCAHAIHKDDILVIPDAKEDERFAENPLVQKEPHIRFYAGAPVRGPDGHKLGTLCIIDRQPRQIDEEELAALRLLADQVEDLFKLRHALITLRAAAAPDVKGAAQKVINSVHHDIATPLTPIKMSLAALESCITGNTEAEEQLQRICKNVDRLQAVLNEAVQGMALE